MSRRDGTMEESELKVRKQGVYEKWDVEKENKILGKINKEEIES